MLEYFFQNKLFSLILFIIFSIIFYKAYFWIAYKPSKSQANFVSNKELLRRISEEAEKYFEEKQHFGISEQNGQLDCNVSANFISSNTYIQNKLDKFQEYKCFFNIDQNGSNRINNWNVTIKNRNHYLCLDSLGQIAELNNYPQGVSCE